MIEPKEFYRQLDSILAKIGKVCSDDNFFPSILMELEQQFAKSLKIESSHVFEQRGDDFIRVQSSNQEGKLRVVEELLVNSDAVQKVVDHKSYIYDDSNLGHDFIHNNAKEYFTVAAISIYSPERHWLMVFELQSNYIREEISLFLNAVRTALNYRLFSEMIWSELDRAVQIQKSLLPKQTPKIKGYDICGRSQPAEMVGGDFYEYFEFDGTFGTSIGDASGHGLPAALLVRDVVIGLRMGLAKEMRIVYTLKKLNYVIQQSTYSTNFVSLFIGEIEEGGHLFYVNAGHPPPFLVTGSKIEDLQATGITLGFLEDVQLTRAHIQIPEGSILVLYTDGIIEHNNGKEEQYDIKRLKALISKNQHLSAKELVDLVYEDVYEFGNRTNWQDDATLVIIKRLSTD